MPLFNRVGTQQEITKEDLVKLGLDPDKAVTKDELTALETRLNTSMTDVIKNSLAELESKLRTPPRTENREENREEHREENNNREQVLSPVDFMEDPVKHATDIANRSAGAVLLQQLKFAADTAWERGKDTLPAFRSEALAAELEAEWKKYPDTAKTNPSVLLRNLHDMVMGRHQEEIMRDSAKHEGKFNIVQSGGGSGRQNTTDLPVRKPEDSLTPEELRAAASFGMTAVEYAASKGGLKYA
jgi:hypothetical protein